MNNFNGTSLQQQQQQQQQHVANVLQTSPTTGAISYLQQPQILQQQHQQQHLNAHSQQLASATAVFDPRALEKTYYTTTAGATNVSANTAASAVAAGERFFTTTGATAATHVPNTILITNNFTQQQLSAVQQQQQQQQQQRVAAAINSNFNNNNNSINNNNIRIVSAAPRLQQNVAAPLHQQHHVYNISSNSNMLGDKDVALNQLQATAETLQLQQHLYQQHFSQQQQQQHSAIAAAAQLAAAQHHYAHQHAAALQLHLPPSTTGALATGQQYFLPSDPVAAAAGATNTAKLLPNTLAAAATTTALIGSGRGECVSATTGSGVVTAATPTTAVGPNPSSTSTVVLDRINICINNHYTDVSAASANAAGIRISSPAGIGVTQQQQPSPIIPAIQHKPIIDSGTLGLLIDPYGISTNSSSNESTQLVIDEPDSTTTTPHTPPTTPESTTSPTPISHNESTDSLCVAIAKNSFAAIANTIEKEATATSLTFPATVIDNVRAEVIKAAAATTVTLPSLPTAVKLQQELVIASTPAPALAVTPLTPPTPPKALTPPILPPFTIGDDVFVKRQDGRLYLGTVIYSACQQFLVRFDDKSEVWCNTAEMRKLGGGGGGSGANSTVPGYNADGDSTAVVDAGPQCVSCKRRSTIVGDSVEICERCGRGYHRLCTAETTPGSGLWQCKRCAKPMKMLKTNSNNVEPKADYVCRQLPYHVATLNWDEKHRVNEEQIYCYCGKSGKFDHNMLQCCKCQNWYHTHCMQNFKSKILRGDGFFVFCCSVCNDGPEFLRRLQLNWVDLMHLTLYNLSAMKKHQHHKYHHLVKDIWPFVLEKRSTLPICKEWIEMPESDFTERIKNTLKNNTDRFICGREIKRDHYYYALRNNGPPILPKISIQITDVLSDGLLINNFNLNLLKGAPENESKIQIATDDKPATYKTTTTNSTTTKSMHKSKATDDIYEFRIEDDEKFTSDDEIPIKHIIEKVKKNKTTPKKSAHATTTINSKTIVTTAADKMEVDDENANDANCSSFAASGSVTKKKSPQKQSETRSPTSALSALPTEVNAEENAEETLVVKPTTTLEKKPESAIVPAAAKSSRKRKAFTLSYKEIADEAAAKRYDGTCSRICDSSSDENSSSSRGTSLDLIIPPPKNFLGLNNPFLMVTPKKSAAAPESGVGKKTVSFGRNSGSGGRTYIKNSIFNTSTLDFSSKLAALKSAGMFPNLSTSNLAKAAGQPRTVRTIKRRLSAKDITIGPNQEVRRRRTRRLSSNIEVISTTTINPIPSNFFPIHAKDLFNTSTSTNHHKMLHQQQQQNMLRNQLPPIFSSTTTPFSSSSASSSPPASTTSSLDSLPMSQPPPKVNTESSAFEPAKPTHGRRLRQRPQKNSPANSRRSSISGASTSSNQSTMTTTIKSSSAAAHAHAAALQATTSQGTILLDLKQSVNKYFGAVNRIESGEQFSIRAKRQLTNGQMQFLIEWGGDTVSAVNGTITTV